MGHTIYTNSKHVDIANHYRLGLTSKLQHYQTTIVRKQLDSTTEKRYDCTFSLVWWESSALNVIVLFSIGGTNTQGIASGGSELCYIVLRQLAYTST